MLIEIVRCIIFRLLFYLLNTKPGFKTIPLQTLLLIENEEQKQKQQKYSKIQSGYDQVMWYISQPGDKLELSQALWSAPQFVVAMKTKHF